MGKVLKKTFLFHIFSVLYPFVAVGKPAQINVGILTPVKISHPVTLDFEDQDFLSGALYRFMLSLDHKGQWQCFACKNLPKQETLYQQFSDSKKLKIILEVNTAIKWGDGTPLSIADIVFSWKVYKKYRESLDTFDPSFIIKSVKKGSQKGTFVVELKDYRVDLFSYLQFPIIRASIDQNIWYRTIDSGIQKYISDSNYTSNPTNASLYLGDYYPKKVEQESIILQPFAYVNKGQKVVASTCKNVPDCLKGLQSGNFDVLADFDFLYHIDDIRAWQKGVNKLGETKSRKRKFKILRKVSPTIEVLHFNAKNPKFLDDSLKQILYDEMFNINVGDSTENLSVEPHLVYLPQKFGIKLSNNNKPLRITKFSDPKKLKVTANSKWPYRDHLLQMMKKKLEPYNLKIKVDKLTPAQFNRQIVERNNYKDLLLMSWRLPINSIPFSLFHSDEIPYKSVGNNGQNLSNYSNVEIDRLINSIMRSKSLAAEKDKINKVFNIIQKSKPIIPLFFHQQILIFNQKKIASLPQYQGPLPSSIHLIKWKKW